MLVFGLAVFLLPLLLLFWSTSTASGRKAYERKLRTSEKEAGPAPPSRTAVAIFIAVDSVFLGLSLLTESITIELVTSAFSLVAIGYFLWFYFRTGRSPLT